MGPAAAAVVKLCGLDASERAYELILLGGALRCLTVLGGACDWALSVRGEVVELGGGDGETTLQWRL